MLSLVQSLVLLLQDSYVSCINIMHLTNEQLRYSKLKDLVLPLEEQGETPVVGLWLTVCFINQQSVCLLRPASPPPGT